jgi:hypothetical protein
MGGDPREPGDADAVSSGASAVVRFGTTEVITPVGAQVVLQLAPQAPKLLTPSSEGPRRHLGRAHRDGSNGRAMMALFARQDMRCQGRPRPTLVKPEAPAESQQSADRPTPQGTVPRRGVAGCSCRRTPQRRSRRLTSIPVSFGELSTGSTML